MPQVCDFSGKVDLDEVQKHFVGIVRYVSDFSPKNITRAEYERAMSLGLTVTLVCEQGNQPALRGRAGGIHDSNIANQQADSLGYPGDATIYYVADDPTPLPSSQWSAVVEYFQALGGRPKGAYGSGPLCAHLLGLGLVAKTWTVSTWGHPAGNSLVQMVGANTSGLAVDVDEIVQSDYGQALQSGGAAPTATIPLQEVMKCPFPSPATFPVVSKKTSSRLSGATFGTSGESLWPMSSGTTRTWVKKQGSTLLPRSRTRRLR